MSEAASAAEIAAGRSEAVVVAAVEVPGSAATAPTAGVTNTDAVSSVSRTVRGIDIHAIRQDGEKSFEWEELYRLRIGWTHTAFDGVLEAGEDVCVTEVVDIDEVHERYGFD